MVHGQQELWGAIEYMKGLSTRNSSVMKWGGVGSEGQVAGVAQES